MWASLSLGPPQTLLHTPPGTTARLASLEAGGGVDARIANLRKCASRSSRFLSPLARFAQTAQRCILLLIVHFL